MKTIKIFLASSEELDYDRMAFGNLVRRLDDMYEKRGIRIKLFEWEDYDSAYNDKRKQDEYNEYVCQSDIFLALFHKKAGQFTIEEFDKASEQFKATASPKVYTYCKDLKPGEEESPELKKFKERLFNEMGHYWCRYDNRESLQFQFVMQLQLVESSQMEDMKVKNGNVTFNDVQIASMDRLTFVTANEEYQQMRKDLQELHKEICDIRLEINDNQEYLDRKEKKLEDNPDDEECQKDLEMLKKNDVRLRNHLQPKLDKYHSLQEKITEQQSLFLNTAKRVAQLQGRYIDNSIRDAIDAFLEGKVREANYILERSEDSKPSIEDYKLCKEITEQKRQNHITYINKLIFWASTIMADTNRGWRRHEADKKYKEAIERAEAIDYDEREYINLLSDYASFLFRYANYKDALVIEQKVLSLQKEIDANLPEIADSYNKLGLIYKKEGNYSKALKYHQKALAIRERIFGEEYLDTAESYNNIGSIYRNFDNYSKALEYYQKSLSIKEKLLGNEHLETADSYNNVGIIHFQQGRFPEALELFQKTRVIYEQKLGPNDPDTAISYNNIGNIYYCMENFSKALEYHLKALDIRRTFFGEEHPDTAKSYYNLGLVYRMREGNINKSLEYFQKALNSSDNYELNLEVRCVSSQSYYKTIRRVLELRNERWRTIDQSQEVLSQCNSLYYSNESETAIHQNTEYTRIDEKAFNWVKKAISINPSDTAAINLLASLYEERREYYEAVEQLEHCLKLQKEQNEPENKIRETEEKIAALIDKIKYG
jgi:tetratricopeptide (TPR) repeat protein